MMDRVILYHADCPDGFGAAWAAWMNLRETAEYIPVRYAEPPPDLSHHYEGAVVYLVDFSYPRDVLAELARFGRVVVLDHHKTAMEALTPPLPPSVFATFDMEKSGAVITWEHFHPDVEVPLLLRYVEDRDLWRWALPASRELSAYVASMPREFRTWEVLHESMMEPSSLGGMIEQGTAILRERALLIQAALLRVDMRWLGGHLVPVVNATVHGSETAEALCFAYPKAPFAAYYLDLAGDRRGWGLRSRGGFDVSAIAKLYGGGGHPAASGFTTGQDFGGDTPTGFGLP